MPDAQTQQGPYWSRVRQCPSSLTRGSNRPEPGHPGPIDNPSTDHLGSLIYDFDVKKEKKKYIFLSILCL